MDLLTSLIFKSNQYSVKLAVQWSNISLRKQNYFSKCTQLVNMNMMLFYLSLCDFHIWVQIEHLQQGSGAAFPYTNDNGSGQALLGGIVRGQGRG